MARAAAETTTLPMLLLLAALASVAYWRTVGRELFGISEAEMSKMRQDIEAAQAEVAAIWMHIDTQTAALRGQRGGVGPPGPVGATGEAGPRGPPGDRGNGQLQPLVEAALIAPGSDQAEGATLAQMPKFDEANLILVAKKIVPQFRECCMSLEPRFDSVARLEALAILSAAMLAKVDVLVESGTASGYSAELMARFFDGSQTLIYAIDKDAEGRNDTAGAANRLSAFPNVKYIPGDSMLEIPKILKRHKGQRIGVFIDGPKEELGTVLGIRTLKSSLDVMFVAQHDVGPAVLGGRLNNIYKAWGRTVLRTWGRPWRKHFSSLDGCPEDPNKGCGWGIALIAGREAIPLGVKGDKLYSDKQIRQMVG